MTDNTVKPRYNKPLSPYIYNEVLNIANDFLYPRNSKVYGKEPRYNETNSYSEQIFPWPSSYRGSTVLDVIKIASTRQFSVLFCLAGLALHCHKCMSTRSWSNCDFNSREMLCPSGTDSCVKLYFGGRVADTYVEGFFKECGSKSLCNEYLCKVLVKDGATIDDCEVNCCDDGLCNRTQAPMVSVLLLLACALVAWC